MTAGDSTTGSSCTGSAIGAGDSTTGTSCTGSAIGAGDSTIGTSCTGSAIGAGDSTTGTSCTGSAMTGDGWVVGDGGLLRRQGKNFLARTRIVLKPEGQQLDSKTLLPLWQRVQLLVLPVA
jgi:hypothetical protein